METPKKPSVEVSATTPTMRLSTPAPAVAASPLSFNKPISTSAVSTPTHDFRYSAAPSVSTPKLTVPASPVILTQPSPTLSGKKVSNSVSMSQFIDSSKRFEELKVAVNQSPSIVSDVRSSTLSLRNSPYRYTAIPIIGDSKLAQGQDKVLLNEQEAAKLYTSLGVDHVMDKWVDQLRLWFAHVLLAPLVEEMKFIETKFGSKLEKMIVQQAQDPSNKANQSSMLNWSSKPNAQSTFQGFTIDLSSFAPTAAQQNDPQQMELFKARLHLERFLHIPNATGTRDYVINRIRELAQGSVLRNFTWTEDKEKKKEAASEWAVEEPTDAQILIHLFCTFMDDKLLPNDPAHKEQPFTARHFIQGAILDKELAEGHTGKSWPMIVLVSSRPPHYNVRVSAESKPGQPGEWCIKKGRLNVFHAIIMFILYLKQNSNGHLHELDLGLKYVQLLNVLS